MKEKQRARFWEELSGMESYLDTEERPDASRAEQKSGIRAWEERLLADPQLQLGIRARQKQFQTVYRITAVVGFIIGCYNMASFFNPGTVWLGFVHLPLLLISLYCAVLSYRHPAFRP